MTIDILYFRKKEYQDEVRAASSKLKTENSGTMRSLTRTQAATGKAYLTVQVKNKWC